MLWFVLPPFGVWILWTLRQIAKNHDSTLMKEVLERIGTNGGKTVHQAIEKLDTEQRDHSVYVHTELGQIKGRLEDGDARMDRMDGKIEAIHHGVVECEVLRSSEQE